MRRGLLCVGLLVALVCTSMVSATQKRAEDGYDEFTLGYPIGAEPSLFDRNDVEGAVFEDKLRFTQDGLLCRYTFFASKEGALRLQTMHRTSDPNVYTVKQEVRVETAKGLQICVLEGMPVTVDEHLGWSYVEGGARLGYEPSGNGAVRFAKGGALPAKDAEQTYTASVARTYALEGMFREDRPNKVARCPQDKFLKPGQCYGRLEAPELWTVAKTGRTLEVGWAMPSDPKRVLRGVVLDQKQADGSWKTIYEGRDRESFTVRELTPATDYEFRIRATSFESLLDSPQGAATTLRTDTAKPEAPMGVHGVNVEARATDVQWTEPNFHGAPISDYTVFAYQLPDFFDKQDETEMEEELEGVEVCRTNATACHVEGLRPFTDYFFRVTAANEKGLSPLSEEGKVHTKTAPPEAPSLVLVNKTQTDARFTWDRVRNNGLPVTEYQLQMKDGGKDGSFGAFRTVWSGVDRAAVAGGLLPGRTYFFRAAAVNRRGVSEWSDANKVVTDPDVPERVRDVTLARGGATSLTLSWAVPHDQGAPISGYIVERDQGNATRGVRVYDEVYRGDATRVTIEGLLPAETYLFTVRAENSEGESVPSAPVALRTDDAPPATMDAVELVGKDHQSLQLQWALPRANGAPISAVVLQMAPGKSGSEKQFATQFNEVGTTWTASAVKPGAWYRFRVASVNALGAGEWSDVVAFQVDARVPDQPAPAVSVYVQSRVIKLTWGVPAHGGLPITSYDVEAKVEGAADAAWVTLGASQANFYKAEELVPATEYAFRVRAVNGKGASEWSDVTTYTTEHAAPDALTRIDVDGKSPVDLRLSWERPVENGDAITEYHLQRAGADDDAWTTVYTGNVTHFHDLGLDVASEYRYRLSSVNAQGESELSEVFAFTTDAMPPARVAGVRLETREATSLTVEWAAPDARGANVTAYQVDVYGKPHDAEGKLGWMKAYEGSTRETVLAGLARSTNYTVRVRAVNAAGSGEWSEPHVWQTAPDVPSQPEPVQVAEKTERSVTLEWEVDRTFAPYVMRLGATSVEEEGAETAQVSAAEGETSDKKSELADDVPPAMWHEGTPEQLEFEVQLAVRKSADEWAPWENVYRGVDQRVHISELAIFTPYRARVRVSNALGWSAWSAAADFRTDSWQPNAPSKPLALKMSVVPAELLHARVRDYYRLYAARDPSDDEVAHFVEELSAERMNMKEVETAIRTSKRAREVAAAGVDPTAPVLATPTLPKVADDECTQEEVVMWGEPALNGEALIKYEVQWEYGNGKWETVYAGKEATIFVPNLCSGRTYQFRVRAFNAKGASEWSEAGRVETRASMPDAVRGVRATKVDGFFARLTWPAPKSNGAAIFRYEVRMHEVVEAEADVAARAGAAEGAKGVEVSAEEKARAAADAKEAADSLAEENAQLVWKGADTSAEIHGLSPVTQYRFSVRAYNMLGVSDASAWLDVRTPSARPSAVDVVHGKAVTATSFQVEYVPPASNGETISEYRVEFAPLEGEWAELYRGDELRAATPADAPLTPATTYAVRVAARNAKGWGDFGSALLVTTEAAAPLAVGEVHLEAAGGTRLLLQWDEPEDNGAVITLYRVEVARAGSGALTWSEAVATARASANVVDLDAETTYAVRVVAQNEKGESPASAEVQFRTLPARHVSTVDGSNDVGTGERDHPWATLEHAVESAREWDLLVVWPGTYAGVGNVGVRVEKNLHLRASHEGRTIVDGHGAAGRALSLLERKSTVEGFVFRNFASKTGGAVFATGDAAVRKCRFADNMARHGGALSVHNAGEVRIEGNVFENNVATEHGGAVFLNCEHGSVWFHDNTVRGNRAIEKNGGGVFVRGGRPSIARNVLERNSATHGAGLFLFRSDADLRDNTIKYNHAKRTGGGVCVLQGAPALTKCALRGNDAGQNGGGVRSNAADTVLRGVTIESNMCGNARGSALFARGGQPTLDDVHVAHNSNEGESVALEFTTRATIVSSALPDGLVFRYPATAHIESSQVAGNAVDVCAGSVLDDCRDTLKKNETDAHFGVHTFRSYDEQTKHMSVTALDATLKPLDARLAKYADKLSGSFKVVRGLADATGYSLVALAAELESYVAVSGDGLLRAVAVHTQEDRERATFRLAPGLISEDDGFVSLESLFAPGSYVVHNGDVLEVRKIAANDEQKRAMATFRLEGELQW